ncbi:MAG: DUF4011 domain-containing protein [Promethearchaeota archaeon]
MENFLKIEFIFFIRQILLKSIMSVSNSKKIVSTINTWLNKLIDLSRRNRQLYFRTTKRSTIKFLKPSYQELYDILVNKRKPMKIIYRNIENLSNPKKKKSNKSSEHEESYLEYNKPLKKGEILTDKDDEELSRSLRNLYSRSRTSFQEQGVNILFLAIGFLEWREATHSEVKILSPLLLIPVLLERESILKPYKLKFFEDDILINPSLSVKLQNDFNITLPEFNEGENEIDKIFVIIEKEIRKHIDDLEWKLNYDVYLGMFSFSKLMMYKDIKDNKNLIKKHKILRDLILETSNEKIEVYPGEIIDKMNSEEIFNVLDADSSQQNVILNAINGTSFCVQGPPGTGKSQTIANIIASFLAKGKSVLFVSEKMAALEVVMKRLSECGLKNYCLELHGYKANKKAVYEELYQCCSDIMEVKKPKKELLRTLDERKRELNNYYKALTKKYPPLYLSAYYLHGELLKLQDIPCDNIILNLDIEEYNQKKFNTIIHLFNQLDNIFPLFKSYFKNPWYGFDLSCLSFDFQMNAVSHFQAIIHIINELSSKAKKIQNLLQIEKELKCYQLTTFYEYVINNNYNIAPLFFELEDINNRFLKKYKNFLRIFKPSYWKDRKNIKNLFNHKNGLSHEEAHEIIKRSSQYKQILSIPTFYKWEKEDIEQSKIKNQLFKKTFFEYLNTSLLQYHEKLKYLRSLFPNIDTKIFDKKLEYISFSKITNWLNNKIKNLDKIEDWKKIERVRLEFEKINEEHLFFKTLKFSSQISNLSKTFKKRFYIKYLDYIYSKDPILSNFESSYFNLILKNFKSLDKKHIDLSRQQIQFILNNIKPQASWILADSSPLNILKKEVIKKRRIKPIRVLFSEIPDFIKLIKPCFLMSPLSISKYLNPDIFQFDIVLFDEASQVRPEDAIGAIMRAKQVLVVGDLKQLPPTSFFQVFYEESDEENYDIIDYESILERFSTSGFQNLMLNFHYRSKNETLIAFSNYHFYNNRLYTFPGVIFKNDNLGIEFEYVPDGIYDRGKSRTNKKEARRVAELVINHFKENPEFSLGVIAFSQAQQEAIEIELENLLRNNLELEKYFNENNLESFFIKNLENVQGDERDYMFFSIGYGKDMDGKLYLNFGPLNKVGGERRLNVAITRARYKVKVISSIKSSEIDITKTKSEGIKLLKQYLEYAEHKGNINYIKTKNINSTENFDSPFEEEVYNALSKLGYTVHTQVGCSGFKIDLAVVHPKYPGRYILGIECDGALYHSSFTARDRDRIRQEILESHGWKIYRIWSRDWAINPKKELFKLVNLLKKLEKEKNTILEKSNNTIKDTNINHFPNSKNNNSKNNIYDDSSTKKSIDFRKLPEEFKEYEKYSLKWPNIFNLKYEYSFKEEFIGNARVLIHEIVKMESPITINELYYRISKCCELKRLTKKMKSYIDMAIDETKSVFKNGDTVWLKEQSFIPVRYPNSAEYRRKIINIPKEEIAQAICYLLRDAFSLSIDEVVLYTGKIFGYNSIS